jgi:hypothetical protein
MVPPPGALRRATDVELVHAADQFSFQPAPSMSWCCRGATDSLMTLPSVSWHSHAVIRTSPRHSRSSYSSLVSASPSALMSCCHIQFPSTTRCCSLELTRNMSQCMRSRHRCPVAPGACSLPAVVNGIRIGRFRSYDICNVGHQVDHR